MRWDWVWVGRQCGIHWEEMAYSGIIGRSEISSHAQNGWGLVSLCLPPGRTAGPGIDHAVQM